MKMMYRSLTNRRKTEKMPIVVGLSILVLLLAGTYIHKSVSPYVRDVSYPALSFAGAVKDDLNFIYKLIRPKGDLTAENDQLKSMIEEVKVDNANLRLQLDDYNTLKNFIRENEKTNTQIVARVLSYPDTTPFDMIIIGTGESGGVSKDMNVYGPYGAKIGTVVSVGKNTSSVRLYSSPGDVTPVLLGEKRIPGEAVGRGGGVFVVSLPRSSAVSVGDSIILSTQPTKLFGVVEAVEATDADSFAKIFFKIPFSFSDLKFISVSAE